MGVSFSVIRIAHLIPFCARHVFTNIRVGGLYYGIFIVTSYVGIFINNHRGWARNHFFSFTARQNVFMFDQQLFMSHAWKSAVGDDTHRTVVDISHGLQRLGWTVWLDEDSLDGNIDLSMASGIDKCDVVIVCITSAYASKANRIGDNCNKEFSYACWGRKCMLPLVMETALLDTKKWPPGIVAMNLGLHLYVDATKSLDTTIRCVHGRLTGAFALRPRLSKRSRRRSSVVKTIIHV